LLKETTDQCKPRDTTSADGTLVKYIACKDEYRIEWSNRGFRRTTDSLYHCHIWESGVWDFIPKLHADARRYLVFTNVAFTSSGGNPDPLEYSVLLFPKNQSGKIRELDFFVDMIGNYLVYSSDFGELHLMNLETDEVQDIELRPTPAFIRSPTIPIEEVCIQDRTLIVEYEAVDENGEDLRGLNFFRIEI